MRLRPGHLELPHPSRLRPRYPRYAAIVAAHSAAVAADEPTYTDPLTGYQVFTARSLVDRATCCDSGCRHCPYLGA